MHASAWMLANPPDCLTAAEAWVQAGDIDYQEQPASWHTSVWAGASVCWPVFSAAQEGSRGVPSPYMHNISSRHQATARMKCLMWRCQDNYNETRLATCTTYLLCLLL